MNARYFVLRLTRFGPLTAARLWWCDSEPEVPDNKLDRGRLSVFPRADIAGVEVNPEELLERLGVDPYRRGDLVARADVLLARLSHRTEIPSTHWKWCKPISAAEYQWRLDTLRWIAERRPGDPLLQPRRRLAAADVAVPDFTREQQ